MQPTVQPFTQQRPSFKELVARHEPSAQPLPENKKKPKDDACDFFHVDIYNIFKHNPEFLEKGLGSDGGPVERYVLPLEIPELSVFRQVNITKYANGRYDLHFLSKSNEVPQELKEFIAYCSDVLGPDFMQKKHFSEDDVRDLRLGVFSRVWRRQMRIENINFTLSLTLIDIPPQTAR
ncbi:MAG: hypothetical protein LBD89_06760 [Tannerellaceae bacterium]|nr:hypothetical protein [Tannerellaceae bacterium]